MTLKPWLTAILFIQICVLSANSYADERENGLKAGFLYNFARYSEGGWFDSTQSTQYNICTTSKDFAFTANQVLKGQKIKDVAVYTTFISLPQYDCHSLFISSDTTNADNFMHSKEFERTMVVGESKGFIQSGGQINFFIAGGRVRFEVDPDQLERHQIKLSSKVLRLGRIVRASSYD